MFLLARVLREVNERGLLCDEQFSFRPRYSTALQLARLVESINRTCDESGIRGEDLCMCPKTFKAASVEDLLYLCEISSSHGGEYDVQSCLLGCTAV
jgi:hypothetical protein